MELLIFSFSPLFYLNNLNPGLDIKVIAWEMVSVVQKEYKIDLLIGRRPLFLFQSLRSLPGEELKVRSAPLSF